MNIKRILTTIVGIPIIIALFTLANPIVTDIILAVVAIRSIYEYSKCAEKTCKIISGLSYIPAILIAFLHVISNEIWLKIFPIIIPLFLLFAFLQVIVTDGKTNYKDVAYTTTGVTYIVSLITFFSLLYGANNGRFYIWYIMISAWGSDIFAYIIGKHFGKHKFSKISPNKTIEGCIAGLLGAVCFGLIYTYFVNNNLQAYLDTAIHIDYWKIGIICAILSGIGQIGDFAASVIKRHFEVKDFSDLFPGHGGMIDRIDSIIFIAPFAYYIFIVLMG